MFSDLINQGPSSKNLFFRTNLSSQPIIAPLSSHLQVSCSFSIMQTLNPVPKQDSILQRTLQKDQCWRPEIMTTKVTNEGFIYQETPSGARYT